MSEREKFDDDGVARGKIATSPEITVDREQVQQRAVNPLQRAAEQVEPLKEDPAADARYSRLLGRLSKRLGLGDEFAAEAEGWGGDLFPLLREVLRNRPTIFRLAVGAIIGTPAVIGGFRLAFKMFRKEEKENVTSNS